MFSVTALLTHQVSWKCETCPFCFDVRSCLFYIQI